MAAVACFVLAGCGGGGGEGSNASGAATSAGASPRTSTPATTTTGTPSTANDGGSQGQVKQAHTTVKQAVDAVLVSGDATKACGDGYVTQHYLASAYGGRPGCVKAQSPAAAADLLRSLTFTVGARKATVTARPAGGIYDGEKLTVSLVKEGQDWKVDSLKSNAPVGP